MGRISQWVTYGKLLLSYVGKPQQVQLAGNAGTVRDKVHHAQPYGLSARPTKGAEAVMVNLGGDAAQSICILIADRRYVLELEEGEAALHDDQGQKVHLTRTGIVIESKDPVRMNTPNVICSGDVTISGISFLGHFHSGISPGSDNTNVPSG